MPHRAPLIVALVAALTASHVASSAAPDDELVVVVNPSNRVDHLAKSELRPIFQTARTTWPEGGRITAFNQPESSSARRLFDKAVLGMSDDEAAKYWTDRKIRGGARPPRRLPSGAAIALVVSQEAGAIGYMARSDADKRVKIVAVIRRGIVAPP